MMPPRPAPRKATHPPYQTYTGLPIGAPDTPWEGEVEGVVDHVRFQSPEGGFCIFSFTPTTPLPRFHPGPISVRFNGDAPKAGMQILVAGKETNHPVHGQQIEARMAAPQMDRRDGLLAFLSSGGVKGVGPALAQAIVKAGGQDILHDTRRLGKIPGIGPKKAKQISLQWQQEVQKTKDLIYLQSLGLGPQRAQSILTRWPNSPIQDLLRDNPYGTLLAVRGIGFLIADQALLRHGVPADSPMRLRAALNTACEERLDREGHTLLTEDSLVEQSVELTGQPAERLRAALKTNPDLVRVRQGAEVYYSTPVLYRAEKKIARRIHELRAAAPSVRCSTPVEYAIQAFERATQKTLSEEQRAAVQLAHSEKIMILTGGPGVGKTTTLFAILDMYTQSRIALCAPSALAAKRMQEMTGRPAYTIHSLLRVTGGAETGYRFAHDEKNPLPADVLVVDESSMLDATLAKSLLSAVPLGCRVIFVGDPDQLPSISPGNVLADLIRDQGIPVARLTEIRRQVKGSQIAAQAARVRDGLPLDPELKGQDFFPITMPDKDLSPAASSQQIAHQIVALVRDRMPARGFDPLRDVQVLTLMHSGACGTEALNVALQEAINPNGQTVTINDRRWRVGDKVCHIKNNKELGVRNGEIGSITAVSPRSVTAAFADDHVVTYTPKDLIQLRLGYAITVHKAQGSEFRAVVMPVIRSQHNMLDQQILYTGITRGKEAVVLFHEPSALRHAIKTNAKRTRAASLPFLLREARGETPQAGATQDTRRPPEVLLDAAGEAPGF